MSGKNKKWLWTGVIVVLCGVIFGALKFKRSEPKSYDEYQIKKGNLLITTVSTGTVQPKNRLEIKPPIAGRIDEVLIQEGEKVEKGQILAWMSSTERAALLDAARSQDKTEVKKWESLYRPTPILAPLEGTIILRNIEAGQTVTNSDAILVMSDKLIVKAQVDETDMALIKLKQNAYVTLDAYSSEVIPATVDHIAYESTTTNNVTTYAIDVLPNTSSEILRAGLTANITFAVEEKENVLLLPTEFISYTSGKTTVLVKEVENKGAMIEKDVRLGLSDGKQSEVLKGLQEGDTVLVEKLSSSAKKSSRAFGQPNFRGGSRKR